MAKQLNNSFDHHCGGGNHAYNPAARRSSATSPVLAGPTNFGQQAATAWSDLRTPRELRRLQDLRCFDPLPRGTKLKLGAQFFNVFNHPNFQNPNARAGRPAADPWA